MILGDGYTQHRRFIEVVLGKLVWCLMLNRPCLSVLSAVYAQLHKIIASGCPAVLWPTVHCSSGVAGDLGTFTHASSSFCSSR